MDAKKKILIVEDNPSQQMALYDAIAKAGFLVRKASSGDEGYQMAVETKPDLIISDKMMPRSSGLLMMNQLRQQSEWGRNVPVLFFSNAGTANEEEIAMLEDIQPKGYLSKSDMSLGDVIQKIRDALGEPRPENPAQPL